MSPKREKEPGSAATNHGPNNRTDHLYDTERPAAPQLPFELSNAHSAPLAHDAARLMADIARKKGTVTIEDVRDRMAIPAGVDARWLGSVPGILVRRGLLRRAGYVRAQRPAARGRLITLWELARPVGTGTDEPTAQPSGDARKSATVRSGNSTSRRDGRPARRKRRRSAGGLGPLFPTANPRYTDPGGSGPSRPGRHRR